MRNVIEGKRATFRAASSTYVYTPDILVQYLLPTFELICIATQYKPVFNYLVK